MLETKIFKYLQKVENGYLEIITPEKNKIEIGNPKSEIKANIFVKDWRLIDLCLTHGDIGFGEGYMENLFETDDLINLLKFFVTNQKVLEDIFHGHPFFSAIAFFKTLFQKNTLNGSKKNISFHYDMSNEFFSLWLDQSMTYSSGIFLDEKDDLKTAQKNKYQRILDNLNSSDSVLEIGCGWGGFLEQGAKNGKKIKALTLSKEQKKFAEERLQKQNLQAQIVLQDYRHEAGKFDNIVSIEMFEAVGKEYWNEFFYKIKNCLNKDGKAVIQTITIDEAAFKRYTKTSDFIRKYIFPGGFLPTEKIFEDLAAKNNLLLVDKYEFAQSYYKTLKLWLENFNQVLPQVKKLGFDDIFIRKWQFYLAYCAAGFYGKRTNVLQYSFINS